MKAVFITGHGGNEVVAIGERPMPSRGPGDVLVRMQAATVNRVDLYMRDSGAGIRHALPQIMGLDGAGVVEEVDADDPLLKPGQQVVLHPAIVCGRCEFCRRGEGVLCNAVQYLGEHRDGTLAEYVSVPARNVFPMPAALSHAEAAALGVTHLTAWRMLFTKGQLKPWQTVLIFGVGGGVSLAALQLAKLAGARAIVTSRDDAKLQRAVHMGADHAINGQSQDVAREVMALTEGRGVDLVIENVGAAVWASAMKSLVRGGRLVTCGATSGDQPQADLRRIFIRQLQILGSTLGDFDEFAALLAWSERHALRPVIDAVYALEQAHAALDHLASGEQFGKIAIRIGSP
ncbi:zinc-binding dehydrogenase [Variovorax sp. J22R133]|uniref:zinc-binding dehydrogenase n=1 Tax=Variovorax brevis TaxID=3053503 RepID=UPI0025779169|nr:zinc-binding dehydrogenase [Variovorax sp. J22R133]MDM0112285.1 zinc-binding dehydrogenase [Variovorax sp. J22R133]